MNESYVQNKVLDRLRKAMTSAVIFKHSDLLVWGIPDISVTDNRLTSHWEFKFAAPRFDSPAQQRETMCRLERTSHCARYVIFDLVDDGRSRATYIVRPSALDTYQLDGVRKPGFDYNWVVNKIISTHYARIRRLHE